MIIRNGKRLIGRLFDNRRIMRVLKIGRIIWESIFSCYGSGAWLEDRPWTDNDGWRDN